MLIKMLQRLKSTCSLRCAAFPDSCYFAFSFPPPCYFILYCSPQAFDKISAQLKGMSKDQLSQLDLNLLVDLMERSANGERVHLPAGSPLKPILTNATLARPSAVSPDSTKNANSNPFSVSPSHQAQPLLAPVLPPLRGLAGAGVGAISVSEEKAAMAGEVKRISLEYNEEKQKLDLMMKIQQARQRQLLQRKLFEKSQRKQQEQQQQQQRADGLFDIDEDGNEYAAYADGKSEYNSVEIGANRGLSNLKLKQANSLQPAFKVRTNDGCILWSHFYWRCCVSY